MSLNSMLAAQGIRRHQLDGHHSVNWTWHVFQFPMRLWSHEFGFLAVLKALRVLNAIDLRTLANADVWMPR